MKAARVIETLNKVGAKSSKVTASVFGQHGSATSTHGSRSHVLSKSKPYSTSGTTLPKEANVVICGTGIVGNSVAYHLVQNGCKDIVVLEQEGQIGRGTSLYGSGTLAVLKPVSEQKIISKSIALYKQLQDEGHDIGFRECGSLYLAQNRERMILLKRRVAINLPQGIECEILGPNQIEQRHPLINTQGVQGAVFVPSDAVADPTAVNNILAELAEKGGAQYVKNCSYQNLITDHGKVCAVDTSHGTIQCKTFVNCAGMWAWHLGQTTTPRVRIPVHPAAHFYLRTNPVELDVPPKSLPTIRDYDSSIYIRNYSDSSFLLGGFEKLAKPIFTHGIPRDWRENIELDWDHFAPLLDKCIHRVPKLKECTFKSLTNAPDNFTPDGKWILGEAPEIDNYFVAAGMNGNSLQGAGGIGYQLAKWITEGEPETPLLQFDVRRFVDVHNTRRFLYERVKETVGRQYAIQFPFQSEYTYGRQVRCSPLFSTLKSQGAVFGTRMCFERPLYFEQTYKFGDENPAQMPEGTYWKPLFFDNLRDEYQACREGVAVIDMSSYAKFQITSAHDCSMEYLQRLCCSDVNIPVGHIVPTGMLNEKGGYENDCMLIRQSFSNFFMICPTKQQTRIAEWLTKHAPADNTVQLNDVTSMYTVLLIIGPKSHELISQLTDEDMRLPPLTYKTITLGHATDVMVLSVTNTGEPGYSLYIPSEFANHVYEALMKYGKDYGIRNAGYLTLRFLRIEKFIPFWAEELDSLTTPLEIGRQFRVKFDKKYFIGKFAMQKQLSTGFQRRLVHFSLDDDYDPENDVWPWGGEPIYRNGVFVGLTTSAGYAFTLDKMVCLGFVTHPDIKTGEQQNVTPEYITDKNALYQIDIAGRRFNVHQSLHPPKLPSLTQEQQNYHPTLREKAILQAKQ